MLFTKKRGHGWKIIFMGPKYPFNWIKKINEWKLLRFAHGMYEMTLVWYQRLNTLLGYRATKFDFWVSDMSKLASKGMSHYVCPKWEFVGRFRLKSKFPPGGRFHKDSFSLRKVAVFYLDEDISFPITSTLVLPGRQSISQGYFQSHFHLHEN